MRAMTPRAVALSVAGSDSGGGAGIQADLRAFAAFGVHGTTAITALTAQGPAGVAGVVEVEPAFVVLQARTVLAAYPVTGIKTGMLASAPLVSAVAALLRELRPGAGAPRVVVDPVMVATSGARLLRADARRAVLDELLPQADLLTPNLPEAAELLGGAPDGASSWSRAEAAGAARELLALGPRAVLVKGGHGAGNVAADVLATRDGLTWIEAPRVDTELTHGTGCMLSAAIAAGLALGWDLESSVRHAKIFVTRALRRGLEIPPPPYRPDTEDPS